MNNHERGIAMLEYKDRLQRATDAIQAKAFVIFGYPATKPSQAKPRKENHIKVVE